ncbi:putative DNA helicase ino80, partial [Bonamia ostreae]
MAPKKEIVIKCELSSRQRILYNAVKDQFRSDFSKRNQDKLAGEKDLYNAVMQFRKVCNHPNIYQKRLKKTPLSFNVRLPPQILLTNLPKEEIGKRILHFEFQNPICFRIPRCVDNEKCQKMDAKYFNKFNVFGVENINGNENFAFAKFFKMTLNEIESYAKSDKLLRWIFDQQKEKNWLNIKKLDFRKHFKNLDEYPNLIKNAFIP